LERPSSPPELLLEEEELVLPLEEALLLPPLEELGSLEEGGREGLPFKSHAERNNTDSNRMTWALRMVPLLRAARC